MDAQSRIVLADEKNQAQMDLALFATVSLHGVIAHLDRPGVLTLFMVEDVSAKAFMTKPEVFPIERVRGGEKLVGVKRIRNAPFYRQIEHPEKGRYAHLLEQKEKLRKKLRDRQPL
jgi:hypothetical protein